jgi:hypothetical protein
MWSRITGQSQNHRVLIVRSLMLCQVARVRQVRLVAERNAGDLAAADIVTEDRRDTVPDERAGVIHAAPGKAEVGGAVMTRSLSGAVASNGT